MMLLPVAEWCFLGHELFLSLHLIFHGAGFILKLSSFIVSKPLSTASRLVFNAASFIFGGTGRILFC